MRGAQAGRSCAQRKREGRGDAGREKLRSRRKGGGGGKQGGLRGTGGVERHPGQVCTVQRWVQSGHMREWAWARLTNCARPRHRPSPRHPQWGVKAHPGKCPPPQREG
eukprot:236584-Chlamydomonas_euryale.AAC.1